MTVKRSQKIQRVAKHTRVAVSFAAISSFQLLVFNHHQKIVNYCRFRLCEEIALLKALLLFEPEDSLIILLWRPSTFRQSARKFDKPWKVNGSAELKTTAGNNYCSGLLPLPVPSKFSYQLNYQSSLSRTLKYFKIGCLIKITESSKMLKLRTPSRRLFFQILYPSLFRWTAYRKNSGLPPNIKITKLGQPGDHRMVAEFLVKNYYRHEPLGIVLGMNVESEVRPWLSKYIEKNFAHSRFVSSQAIDESRGLVVGVNVAIVVDPKQPKPPLMVDFLDPAKQPVQHQIRVFLDEIEEGLDAAELLGLKGLTSDIDPRVLNNLMVSVHQDYWKQDIATALVRKSVELGRKDKDCMAAKVVVTSEYSYKAYLNVGYQVIREFQYEKYRNPDGVKIFEGKASALGINTSSRVMIKDLTSK